MNKFWGEIYSENCQLFESFYRFQFTLMYHEKSIFLSESTGSVALIFHHNLLSYASVNSKHQHPPRATPRVLHSTAAPGPGFVFDDLPGGPGFCISIKLRLVQ